MARLYWSAEHQSHWIGFTPESGYVIFPAEENGWGYRKPLLDSLIIREVPSWLAFNTGFPISTDDGGEPKAFKNGVLPPAYVLGE
jgi:hypothetical protein